MKFITIRNLDRNVDEQVNADHIARLRDVQNRDQARCTVTFSSGDTLTALGTSEELLSAIHSTVK